MVLALSALCFVWVLLPLARHRRELAESLAGGALLQATLVSVLLYTLLVVLVALAWWWLSGIYGERPSPRAGYGVFARSQVAKYLPGNAFHYVSRQLLGREAGLSHQALVASSLLELGSLMLAALLVLATSASSRWATPEVGGGPWPWILALALGLGCVLALPGLDLILRRLKWTRRWMRDLPHLSPAVALRLLGPSLGLHLVFFIGTGMLLIVLISSLTRGDAGPDIPTLQWTEVWRWIHIFPLAWAAGTMTVGAPAGAGVREAILTLQLEPLIGAAPAATIALALRLVTTGGDLLTALVGWAVETPTRE